MDTSLDWWSKRSKQRSLKNAGRFYRSLNWRLGREYNFLGSNSASYSANSVDGSPWAPISTAASSFLGSHANWKVKWSIKIAQPAYRLPSQHPSPRSAFDPSLWRQSSHIRCSNFSQSFTSFSTFANPRRSWGPRSGAFRPYCSSLNRTRRARKVHRDYRSNPWVDGVSVPISG